MPPKRPIRAYKFLNHAYVDGMLEHGTIKVGTAVEYRMPDGEADGRSDPYEVAQRWRPGPVTIPMDQDHPFVRHIYYVRYISRKVTAPFDGLSIFEKDTRFRWQKELRIAAWGKAVPDAGKVIQIPGISSLLRRMF